MRLDLPHPQPLSLGLGSYLQRRRNRSPKARLLLQAGTDPTITGLEGYAALPWIQRLIRTYHDTIALLKHALVEAEKASLLVKARRLTVAATTSTAAAPSYVQRRMARGQPLPHVALAPVAGQQNGLCADEEAKEARKLQTTLAFMCGLGREGMPRDVLRVVMDLLMPSWNPLRRKSADTGPPDTKLPAEGEAEVGSGTQGASSRANRRRGRKGR